MALLCCNGLSTYRPLRIDHESKFDMFKAWAAYPRETSPRGDVQISPSSFIIQLVRQVNFGPIEAKRYFGSDGDGGFVEVREQDIINANFRKVNSYKNFKCAAHSKFYEFNLYQRDPVNMHHWRADVARPASEIDL
ncbi:hypothetical protein Micbo1qcDRAFT_181102 [Microdochium bolleyi]|uniref:Uncharacterized protein n=1 Tax=Microdochium bolleyi TaxID=196109 RepID=A0A136IJG3_9PEZI|nr:hypothetical protein Micbo1qcDRAFT_181102 [Microdochium bolleyi]